MKDRHIVLGGNRAGVGTAVIVHFQQQPTLAQHSKGRLEQRDGDVRYILVRVFRNPGGPGPLLFKAAAADITANVVAGRLVVSGALRVLPGQFGAAAPAVGRVWVFGI